jgi:DNA-binding NarL/FixJ family response regulator
MTTTGMDLSPARVRSRQQQTAWLTRHGWTAREIARELNVTMRTVTRYRARAQAGERR